MDNQRDPGDCHYPDIDLHLDIAKRAFTHKDGSSY
jgi:hypothetical protein